LTLGGDGVLDACEVLAENESQRTTAGSIAVECASLVFGEALVEAKPRDSDVIGTVGAPENVKISAVHRS
jgi:hypothetical protein